MYEYPVDVHIEDGCVWVSSPDIPELHSAGDTEAEALLEAVEGLESALSIYVSKRRNIPTASKPKKGQQIVSLPALTVAKIALWNAMMEQGIGKADLARRLGVNLTQVDRLVDFLHNSKIEAVEHALELLGKRIRIVVEAA
ncbi:type II toxin-antitoxin system HicB family antitoxin [Pseudomonas luteola]|uniref:type II toxin-antitoxin system HicB family antitoxin n=1 Tax=Pseudomonas luteola TaxID=47886 RepID=UPI0015E42FF1|nr:type II toxin-antitoxin system HicB family antitoxin [Pseudomonas zeshuii]MBA1250903.1 type II toxin-antitoxin system HicB family antitoxin [Pseudomonas zeshuii]